MSFDEAEIPYFGSVVIFALSCPQCGYRTSDVFPVEERPPSRFSCIVSGPGELNIRVVRSGTSTVIIPELGLRIDPVAAQNGYITNIEGILVRVLSVLEQIEKDFPMMEPSSTDKDLQEKLQKTRELRDRINRLREGRSTSGDTITVIIEDPLGNSAIIGEGSAVKKEPLFIKDANQTTIV